MDTNTLVMAVWLPIAIVAIVQASFSLSISVLTLLSGVSLANHRVKRGHGALMTSFVAGSIVITLALLAGLAWVFRATGWSDNNFVLMVLISALMTAGFAVLLFYYRYDPKGTRLWLPRRFAERIYAATKRAGSVDRSFLLGGMAVLLEIVFIIFPMTIAAYIASSMTGPAYYLALIVYTVIAVAPQIALAIAYARGYKVGAIQRWREQNKRFLQITAGVLMITLSIYLLTYMA
ncbi:MAG TPA: hypothetical protein PKC04_02945 [Candidatus Nanoperiomorbaceae bacterium]|nr:hypothetical protein [Candidatus Nanoperiomorbaceae bacterium]